MRVQIKLKNFEIIRVNPRKSAVNEILFNPCKSALIRG